METLSTGDLTVKSVQTIRPHIVSCVKHLTLDQWSLVQSGALDISTKHRLAHMLLNIFRSFSHVWSKKIKEGAPINQVHDALYDSLSCSFTEALLVKSVPGSSINRLTKLMVSEVTYYVKASETKTRIIPPGKLSAMICSAAKVLKVIARKMKRQCCLQTHCLSRGGQTLSVQDVLMDKATEIIEPILDDVTDTVYNLLEKTTSLENQCAADDIAESVTVAMSLQETEDPDPGLQQHKQQLVERAKRKICDFFAKRLIKASMCQIISQVKSKFTCGTKAGDGESLRSLLTVVESVLLAGEKVQSETSEVALHNNLKDVLFHKAFVITAKLSPLLYRHITGEDSVCRVSGPWLQHSIYQDIKSRVICFLSLMSWWLSNQEVFSCSLTVLRDRDVVVTSQLQEDERGLLEEKQLQEEEEKLHKEKQLQEEEKQIQEEEKRLQEEEIRFQEEEKRFQEEEKWFQEEEKRFQEEEKQLQEEEKKLHNENQLQEEEKLFQKEDKWLQEEEKKLHKDKQLQEEEKQLQKEEIWFQEEEIRFLEEEKQFHEEEKQSHEEEKQSHEEEKQSHEEEKQSHENEKQSHEDEKQFNEEKQLQEEEKQFQEEKQLQEEEKQFHEEKQLQEEEKQSHEEEKQFHEEKKQFHEEKQLQEEEKQFHEEENAALLRTCAEHVQDAADVTGNSRFFLRSIITKLFLNATLEVKQSSVIVPNLESKVNTLLDGIWAELEGTKVAIALKDVDHLRKAIVKELHRQYCSPLGLLVSMESGCSEGLQTSIATCVKVHLSKRSRSVSRVSDIFRKIFRRVHPGTLHSDM